MPVLNNGDKGTGEGDFKIKIFYIRVRLCLLLRLHIVMFILTFSQLGCMQCAISLVLSYILSYVELIIFWMFFIA